MHATYGLIGYPLGHSFSKGYFTHIFEENRIDAEYKNFELPSIEELTTVLREEPALRGFNVTIPYKQQVIPFLHEIDNAAAAIGAVNVVKATRQSDNTIYLKGYNTDVIGFTDSIRPLLQPHHTHALILGTGGASKAVKYAIAFPTVRPPTNKRAATARQIFFLLIFFIFIYLLLNYSASLSDCVWSNIGFVFKISSGDCFVECHWKLSPS